MVLSLTCACVCACRVKYATGEEETLDIDEVANEQQMNLLA